MFWRELAEMEIAEIFYNALTGLITENNMHNQIHVVLKKMDKARVEGKYEITD